MTFISSCHCHIFMVQKTGLSQSVRLKNDFFYNGSLYQNIRENLKLNYVKLILGGVAFPV